MYKLDSLVNKCKKRYHQLIKLKGTDVKSKTHINSDAEKKMITILSLKLTILREHQNISKFCKMLQNKVGLKKFLLLKKLKTTVTVTLTYVKTRL